MGRLKNLSITFFVYLRAQSEMRDKIMVGDHGGQVFYDPSPIYFMNEQKNDYICTTQLEQSYPTKDYGGDRPYVYP